MQSVTTRSDECFRRPDRGRHRNRRLTQTVRVQGTVWGTGTKQPHPRRGTIGNDRGRPGGRMFVWWLGCSAPIEAPVDVPATPSEAPHAEPVVDRHVAAPSPPPVFGPDVCAPDGWCWEYPAIGGPYLASVGGTSPDDVWMLPLD